MTFGQAIAGRALDLVGTPFRLRGRSTETGLDCVGLVWMCLRDAAWPVTQTSSYQLRGMGAGHAADLLHAAGLTRVAQAASGDIVLARCGPMQLHLMIRAGAGHVQAHAGLGRVVFMPGAPAWPLLGIWRAIGSGQGN